ncbi:MAG: C-terminal binding protein [Chloroflexi bacterium]|nr:C-terminal binding protein [Chloroflexota bacterium]
MPDSDLKTTICSMLDLSSVYIRWLSSYILSTLRQDQRRKRMAESHSEQHRSRFKVALVEPNNQPAPPWVTQGLEGEGIEFIIHECRTPEELVKIAGDADVVWVFGDNQIVTAENLALLPRCGALIRSGSGTDNVPVEAATKLGIIVANTPEAVSDQVSDHVIGLLFAVVRQVALQDRLVHAGMWNMRAGFPNWHVDGQTLGLVGFGHIARLLVRKLRGFELTVLAHDPFVSAEVMESFGVRPASLEEVLSQSDFVSLHCPLLKSTHHLMSEREFKLMKPRAILINTSRGPIVDEAALLRALTEGWIAAAGLDVFEEEPTPPGNPLLKLDNVVATPHIAGYSDRYLELFWRYSMETAIDLSKGRWPRSYVNRSVQPRWNLK